jgi:hypothetical protein
MNEEVLDWFDKHCVVKRMGKKVSLRNVDVLWHPVKVEILDPTVTVDGERALGVKRLFITMDLDAVIVKVDNE